MSTRFCYVKIPDGKYCQDVGEPECSFLKRNLGFCSNYKVWVTSTGAKNDNFVRAESCTKDDHVCPMCHCNNAAQLEFDEMCKHEYPDDVETVEKAVTMALPGSISQIISRTKENYSKVLESDILYFLQNGVDRGKIKTSPDGKIFFSIPPDPAPMLTDIEHDLFVEELASEANFQCSLISAINLDNKTSSVFASLSKDFEEAEVRIKIKELLDCGKLKYDFIDGKRVFVVMDKMNNIILSDKDYDSFAKALEDSSPANHSLSEASKRFMEHFGSKE